jgi:hypothetical protein
MFFAEQLLESICQSGWVSTLLPAASAQRTLPCMLLTISLHTAAQTISIFVIELANPEWQPASNALQRVDVRRFMPWSFCRRLVY